METLGTSGPPLLTTVATAARPIVGGLLVTSVAAAIYIQEKFNTAGEAASPRNLPSFTQSTVTAAPAMTDMVMDLLAGLHALDGAIPTDNDLYRVVDFVESELAGGRLQSCDMLLRKADVTRLHVDVLVGILCSTLAASGDLDHRAAFADRVRAELHRRDIPAPEILEILSGIA